MTGVRFLALSLILLATFITGAGPDNDVVFRDGNKSWVYRISMSHGWTVYIHKNLIGDQEMVRDLSVELDKSFSHIEKVIPANPLAFLKTIPIWVDR